MRIWLPVVTLSSKWLYTCQKDRSQPNLAGVRENLFNDVQNVETRIFSYNNIGLGPN